MSRGAVGFPLDCRWVVGLLVLTCYGSGWAQPEIADSLNLTVHLNMDEFHHVVPERPEGRVFFYACSGTEEEADRDPGSQAMDADSVAVIPGVSPPAAVLRVVPGACHIKVESDPYKIRHVLEIPHLVSDTSVAITPVPTCFFEIEFIASQEFDAFFCYRGKIDSVSPDRHFVGRISDSSGRALCFLTGTIWAFALRLADAECIARSKLICTGTLSEDEANPLFGPNPRPFRYFNLRYTNMR